MRCAIFTLLLACGASAVRSPVILMPGDGGSKLQIKADEVKVPHFYCKSHLAWQTGWLSEISLVPPEVHCFNHRITLNYNSATHSSSPAPGIQIKTTDFGATETMEWLDDLDLYNYFGDIVKHLTKELGYVRKKDLFGAPFDFRYAPNTMGSFYKNLTALIEKAYSSNNSTRVTLLGHSLGNLHTLYLLQHKSAEWKDKFVERWISMSGPFGGSMQILRLLTGGYSLGVAVVNGLNIRGAQRSFPSSHYLVPSKHVWAEDEVLLRVGEKNWTLANLEQYYAALNISEFWPLRKDTEPLLDPVTAPGVELHVLHGINVTTTGGLIYEAAKWPDGTPTIVPENGDGTVTDRSLYVALNWRKYQKKPIYHNPIDKADHQGILHNAKLLQYLTKVLGSGAGIESKISTETAIQYEVEPVIEASIEDPSSNNNNNHINNNIVDQDESQLSDVFPGSTRFENAACKILAVSWTLHILCIM